MDEGKVLGGEGGGRGGQAARFKDVGVDGAEGKEEGGGRTRTSSRRLGGEGEKNNSSGREEKKKEARINKYARRGKNNNKSRPRWVWALGWEEREAWR